LGVKLLLFKRMSVENSYGVNSSLVERPPAVVACTTQSVGVCP